MNILFISPNSPFESIGGIERYLLNIIDYFQGKKEYSVTIILPTTEKNHFEKKGDVSIYFSENLNPASEDGKQKGISKKAKLFAKEVESILDEQKIDIICAENFHLGLPAVYSLLLNMVVGQKKIPLVLRIHSFAKTELQGELIKQLMWDHISCVSKSVTGDCFSKGANINILSTDYLGVNTDIFKSEPKSNKIKDSLGLTKNNKIILTATRIIEGKRNILHDKGLINLIQAFSKISSRFPELKLLIAVGTPPERLMSEFNQSLEMLMGYLKLHNVENNVIVKTFGLDEMPLVYRESNVFVLASENETFGQVFIEAMASGLPTIGTKVGGIPEIISDAYSGYLIPPNDSSILAQRIEKLIIDTKTSSKFSKAGMRAVSSRFSLDKQLANFVKMLEKTVSDNK